MPALTVLAVAEAALAGGPLRVAWARAQVDALAAPLGRGDVLLAERVAALRPPLAAAQARGVAVVEFDPDGRRYRDDRVEPAPWTALAPTRPEALAAATRAARARGWRCRGVALCDARAPDPHPALCAPDLAIEVRVFAVDGAVARPRVDLAALHAAAPAFAPGDLVFVDVETLGKVPLCHGLVEVGVIRVDAAARVERVAWEARVLPHAGHAVDPESVAICGYDPRLWAQTAVPEEDVLDALDVLLAHRPVIAGHNPSFDERFLLAAYARAERAMPGVHREKCNTVRHANALKKRGLIPDAKLGTVARFLGVEVRAAHRALPDARCSLEVLRVAHARGIVP